MHIFPFRAVPFGYGHMMGGGVYPFAGWFAGLLLLAALVGLAVWLISRASRGGHIVHCGHAAHPMAQDTAPGTDDALSIARARFARGEIDAEQYRAIVQTLNS